MYNLLRSPQDESTIGIVLCKSKDKTTVEYALQGIQKSIGMATFQLERELPDPLKGILPTAEQLEVELNAVVAGVQPEAEEME